MKLASCRWIVFRKIKKKLWKDCPLCFLHKDLATNNFLSSTDYGNYFFFNGKWKTNFSQIYYSPFIFKTVSSQIPSAVNYQGSNLINLHIALDLSMGISILTQAHVQDPVCICADLLNDKYRPVQCHKAPQMSHRKSSYKSRKENNSQNNYIEAQSTLSIWNAEHKSLRQVGTPSAACWNAAQGVGPTLHRVSHSA